MEKQIKKVLVYIILLFLCIGFIFPFYWMVLTSIRTEKEIYAPVPTFWPEKITFSHFKEIWVDYGFSLCFKNSLISASITMIVSTILSTFGAYAIARFRFKGRSFLDQFILFVYLVPVILMIVPFFLTLSKLGLNDTRIGLILGLTCYCLPFSLWVLKGFFAEIPQAIEEAALVDGATRMQTFYKILLPLSLPGIIAVSLFSFILAWNDYLFALVFLDNEALKTLPIVVAAYSRDHGANDGLLMASGVITVGPAAILYLFLQRYFVSGLSSGAVKG